jgi:hypothetical protein
MADLAIDYTAHDSVRELVEWLRYTAEYISLKFTGWDELHVKGPGLYFAVVADREYGEYADAMGSNRWPSEECRSVCEESFTEACREVAFERDGGVVVAVDGVIESQMVRFRDLGPNVDDDLTDDIGYEEWMGSRHMSAIETSIRPEVVATVTLSEETGRVSVFRNGQATTAQRDDLGGQWRVE